MSKDMVPTDIADFEEWFSGYTNKTELNKGDAAAAWFAAQRTLLESFSRFHEMTKEFNDGYNATREVLRAAAPPAHSDMVMVPRSELEWIAQQYDDSFSGHENAMRLYDVSCTAKKLLLSAAPPAQPAATLEPVAQVIDGQPYWINGILPDKTQLYTLPPGYEGVVKEKERYRNALLNLRRYVACEGNDENGKCVGLYYDSSIEGPIGREDYPLFEFAEAVERWLHNKIDAALLSAQGETK